VLPRSHLLSNSIEQSASLEADSSLASPVPCIVWNPQVHYRV